MRAARHLARVSLLAVIASAPIVAYAQRVRGTAVLADSTTPAAGAIVELLAGSGGPAVRALANQRGEFSIDGAAPGRFTLRILRIGLRPTVVANVELAAGETRTVRAVLTAEAVVLTAVTVRGREQCRIRPDSGQAVARVWEEARKALLASRLAAAGAPLYAEWIKYERRTEGTERQVLSQSIVTTRALTTTAFRSAPVDSLLTVGFVVQAADGAVYRAPDADVLLSDAFAATHCLRLEAPADGDPRAIGVRFEPAGDRDKITDIGGTFWIDRASSELRSLDFQFTGIPEVLREAGAGGHVEFLRLATGNWLINRWHVKMVQIATPTRESTGFGGAAQRDRGPQVSGIVFVGGDVTNVTRRDSVLYTTPFPDLVVRVTSRDSLVPVAGASVTLRGTDYASATDGNGLVRLAHLLPGSYRMSVHTPLLDAARSKLPERDVDVAMGSAHVDSVTLPTARDILRDACGRDAVNGNRSLLYGFVRDSIGRGVARATVSASWLDRADVVNGSVVSTDHGVAVSADDAGRWRLCDVEHGVVMVRSETDAGRDAEQLRLADGEFVHRVDLDVRPGKVIAAGATLSLLEVTTTGPGGAQVAAATLDVTAPSGAVRHATTNEYGLALIPGVELGVNRVRVRKTGYMGGDIPVRAAPGRNTVPILLDANRVPVLDSARAVANRPSNSALDGYESRRARGFGVFLTRAQIEKRGATTPIELLSGIAGISVRRDPGGSVLVSGRGQSSIGKGDTTVKMLGCVMATFIDGTPLGAEALERAIRAENIEGIEIYASTAETPVQFRRGTSECGTILIWSRVQ
jgi:hypothetical protein